MRAPDAEALLQRQEAILPVLDRLHAEGAIGGAEIAARLLPSAATQRARQAQIPERDELARRVAAAAAGLPFREDAFRPFLDDAEASRTSAPVTRGDVTAPLLAARIGALLFERDGAWFGPIVPTGLHDAAAFRQAMAAAGALPLDLGAEAGAIVARTTDVACRWLAVGGAVALLVLLAGTRDPRRVARIALSILSAGLVTLAVLRACDVRLSMIHIVALQFVAGAGLDYALFFARPQLDGEERARTLRTLVICNALTVTTFGLLAACRTPLLRQIGFTVTVGALAALAFSFLFAGPKPAHETV